MTRVARVVLGIGIALVAGGCAGTRLADGVFHSAKGYRVAVPGPDWQVVSRTRADLELRHRVEPAGMLVKASCDGVSTRADLKALARHLLAGLRDRVVVSAGEISLNGKVAHHAVLDGRADDGEDPVRVELYVMRDARCVYDLLYVAPPASFDDWRPAFARLVESFQTE